MLSSERKVEERRRKMKKKISFLKLYFGFFGILSAILLGLFINECVDYVRGTKTQATISEVHPKSIKTGSRHQTSSKQTNLSVQYLVEDELIQSTVVLRGNKMFSEGDLIKISYLPEKPEKQVSVPLLKQDAVFMVLYGIFMAAQIMVVIKARKKKPEPKDVLEQNYA